MEFIIPSIALACIYLLFITVRDYMKWVREMYDASIELEQKAKEWEEYMKEIKSKTEELKKQLKE
jgi:hypothetical protein